ncbi:MAG: carbon monoxide dehydrogenase subunit G [Parvibaculaceae bacterium]
MKMSGEELIPAPQQKVWEALNDPDVLKQCIPGCEEINKTSPTEFEARVVARVGPVKATFNGAVKLSDIDAPNGYTISGEGKGGAAGFAKGGAKVRLTPEGDSTRLAYDVDAQVGGKLAQIGSRLIDSTAKKMADEFFGRFAEIAGGGATVAEASVGAETPAAKPQTTGKTGLPSWVVPAIIAILLGLGIYLLGRL